MKLMLPILSLAALALALGGCAADADADVDASAAAVTSTVPSTSPITLQNYLSHPRIQAIRSEVTAIDSAPATQEEKVTCDATATKFETAGKVRKVHVASGEGDWSFDDTSYFRESGKLLFYFAKSSELPADGTSSPVIVETRVYFDEAGRQIFQVRRQGTEPDFVPVRDSAFSFDGSETWQTTYEIDFCSREGRGD